MSPLVYVHDAVRIPFYVLMGIFVISEQRTRWHSLRDRDGEHLDRGSFYVVVSALGAGFTGGLLCASLATGAAISAARWPICIAGLCAVALGLGLRQWAVAALGQAFTVDVRVRAGQQVIDSGPYRWVRHPSYTGLLMICLGVGLALSNWVSFACLVVVPTLGIIARIRVEERAMFEQLGEPYRRFAAGRARLIPWLW